MIAEAEQKLVKCLVWDLDNTLWRGTLLEGGAERVSPSIRHVIHALDARGILQSIASKNEHAPVEASLREQELYEYFLFPQVGWGTKSAAIERIAKKLNIGLDALAFIDDDPFERAEVSSALPSVRCFDARDVEGLLDRPELNPRFATEDAGNRRRMYLADQAREAAEESFQGPKDEFLASLNMTFGIRRCRADDLARAEELTVRTNQLNATGRTYSYEELDQLRRSDQHLLLVASLDDRFGSHGKIGLCLVECGNERWTLELMLMSCRVMSRGVGTVMLNHVQRLAQRAGRPLFARFVPTDRNRMMYVTYKFAGFTEVKQEVEASAGELLLASTRTDIPVDPAHLRVEVDAEP